MGPLRDLSLHDPHHLETHSTVLVAVEVGVATKLRFVGPIQDRA